MKNFMINCVKCSRDIKKNHGRYLLSLNRQQPIFLFAKQEQSRFNEILIFVDVTLQAAIFCLFLEK